MFVHWIQKGGIELNNSKSCIDESCYGGRNGS